MSTESPVSPSPAKAQTSTVRGYRWLRWVILFATVVVGIAVLWTADGGALGPRVTRATFRAGTVARVEGGTPLQKAATCELWVLPAGGYPHNCRLEVRCGSLAIYGARKDTGYADCQVVDGIAATADESAPDDDPDVHYDRAAGRVVVREPGSWEVELALE